MWLYYDSMLILHNISDGFYISNHFNYLEFILVCHGIRLQFVLFPSSLHNSECTLWPTITTEGPDNGHTIYLVQVVFGWFGASFYAPIVLVILITEA